MSDVLLLAAMAEESRPVLAGRDYTELNVRRGRAWRLEAADKVVTLVTCGIGLVNAAVSTALAIETHQPRAVVARRS